MAEDSKSDYTACKSFLTRMNSGMHRMVAKNPNIKQIYEKQVVAYFGSLLQLVVLLVSLIFQSFPL